jgi:hypothetical protein
MRSLDTEIMEWRTFVGQGSGMNDSDVDELEDHLRGQIFDLTEAGLTEDEAFLVAVKRVGAVDELSREFASEHSARLWRQLIGSGEDDTRPDRSWMTAVGFAIATAATVVAVLVLAGYPESEPAWLLRNAGFLILPFLAGYFVVKQRLAGRQVALTASPFLLAAVLINIYPYRPDSSTELLVAIHLPVVLWFSCGYPYAGADLGSHQRRMDFVRFTGEWLIYYTLIALGGGVLLGLTAVILEPTGTNVERVFEWVLPAGAMGAVIIAAWLVQEKQRVIENMAPVLTMIFTPLFALMLTVAVIVYATTGLGAAFDRELLVGFDALLIVVLGLVLYGISARADASSPSWTDRIQLIAVVAALALDGVVLGVMIGRIADLGFTPNRLAALGLNVVLLVNLAGSAWLSARLLSGKGTFYRLERWQTTYLPTFPIWAAVVVVLFPPLFSFG